MLVAASRSPSALKNRARKSQYYHMVSELNMKEIYNHTLGRKEQFIFHS